MRKIVRLWSTLVIAALLAALGVVSSAGGALAYGKAEQPLAQIELSANCNDPAAADCQVFGLGGVWLWIEIDAGGSGDVAGAGCGHIRGPVEGAQPPYGGAGPIKGDITWVRVTLPPGVFPYWTDPTNTYYLVFLSPTEAIPFPVTVGHYSYTPSPTVAFQLQVAP